MATPDQRAFLRYPREDARKRPVEERRSDWRPIQEVPDLPLLARQTARCMGCGVPFCQGPTGCPLDNLIPDWNDLVRRGHMQEALTALHATNNFPEFTGILCPAPCESACVLDLVSEPVTIRGIEAGIIEHGFANGWVRPQPAAVSTGRKVAVVGSGPAGLAAAQQLARAGHQVVVFEKAARPGGLLRYGIPDFKIDKAVVERRLRQLEAEGVEFRTGVEVGRDVGGDELQREYHAVCLTVGAGAARDLEVPGRELAGIHLAMEYLTRQNQAVSGEGGITPAMSAEGKHVVIIGGGDTGSD
jgi:glutamate synthase (NADPH/NADH) small chain